MDQNIRFLLHLLGSGCFVFLDQLFKYLARTSPSFSSYLFDPWLGWEYFANPGIAFSIPFSNTLLIFGTPIIILGLLFLLLKQERKDSLMSLGLVLLIFGAFSNWIDRVFFHVTIDYLRIATGVINLADVMIVVGVLFLLCKKTED